MTSRRKNAEKEFWKIGGLILELFALPILIMDAVLLNMDIDRSTTGILLLIGICLFFSGLILSHLPQETKNKEEKER